MLNVGIQITVHAGIHTIHYSECVFIFRFLTTGKCFSQRKVGKYMSVCLKFIA